ncbi:Secreted RxLR effector peptide protein [Phytophthora palmivora]|uniref:Secreted RxLR effector peptide protein n=1 Tax=Phytophthora palmivora TaxID=4796 RepID=A0A2P4YTJ2_9STRA|nr:Secreted RxLR effector peptide protein [Phytophthora palmivora]
MGLIRTTLLLSFAATTLFVLTNALPEVNQTPMTSSNSISSRLRRHLESFESPDDEGLKEERGGNGFSFKSIGEKIPFTKLHKEATDVKKAAANEKRLEEIRNSMIRNQRDEYLNSKFAQFFLASKTVDDVVSDMKNAGKLDVEITSVKNAYSEFLDGLLHPKIK